ncbi:MAG: tetratricopeptide repeat protein [Acidobacteriota bacterium]
MSQPTNPKIEELRARLDLEPNSRLFFPLAEELRKVGRYDEAERVLRDGIDTHPAYLSAWVSLGRVLAHLGRHPMAVESFKRALKLDPENVVAARLMAESCLAMGDKLEAIKKFKLVHALLPSDQSIEAKVEELERELNPHLYMRTVSVDSSSEFRNLEPDPGQDLDESTGTVTMRIADPQDRFVDEPLPGHTTDTADASSRFTGQQADSTGFLYRELIVDEPHLEEPGVEPSPAIERFSQVSTPMAASSEAAALPQTELEVTAAWSPEGPAIPEEGNGNGQAASDQFTETSSDSPWGIPDSRDGVPQTASILVNDRAAADEFFDNATSGDPFSDLALPAEAFSPAGDDIFDDSPVIAAPAGNLVPPTQAEFGSDGASQNEVPEALEASAAQDRVESHLRVVSTEGAGDAASREAAISRLERWLAIVNRNAGERV